MIPRSIVQDLTTIRPKLTNYADYSLMLQIFGAAMSGQTYTYFQLDANQLTTLAACGYMIEGAGPFYKVSWDV